MKTIPPTDNTPATGKHYWRGLDQLAETPEFKEYLQREFPEGASELNDPVSRRHFMKIMSASFALAGIGLGSSGCRRPEDKLTPFAKAPEDYIHGTYQFYATAMPTRGGAIPLVAKAYENRPIKVEGNPLFPGGNGGTDRFAQASLLGLYDPDRATRFAKHNGKELALADQIASLDALSEMGKKFAASKGEGLALLAERTQSPSRRRLQKEIAAKMPNAKWFLYDAIDSEVHQRAATKAFGKSVKPIFRYDKADVILSLDCDFIGSEEDAHNNIRRFTEKRKLNEGDPKHAKMSRLYSVESLFTLTGLNADHRLRLPASAVIQVAAAIAAELGVAGAELSKPADVDLKWITECAKDLKASGKTALVVAGYRQPLAVHLLAYAINNALGSVSKGDKDDAPVELIEAAEPVADGLPQLVDLLKAKKVDTLVIIGANPVYNAPSDLDWSGAQGNAKTVVRLGYSEDETGATCHWHFPMAHYLESWGDALTSDGTLVPIQPIFAPLFGGVTELEFLARVGGLVETSANKIVRATFAAITGDDSEAAWNMFLHNGHAGGAAKKVSASFNAGAIAGLTAAVAPSKDSLEVVLYRDTKLDDGRYANNGWLQELPEPITKIVWDNVVLVSRKTARDLGVVNGDVVEVTIGGNKVKGAIWTQPGMANYSLGIALGYGRTRVGRVGVGTGFNAYPLFTTKSGYITTGATVKKTGETYKISCTQSHWSMEGRAIVREGNLEQFREHPDFAEKMNAPEAPDESPIYPNPLDAVKGQAHHQWGMAIDLNSCVGCGTCMMACQSENNIPIVGKDLVNRGREMHWIRIDRYFASDPAKHKWKGLFKSETFKKDTEQQFQDWIDDVQAVNQPMMCQHCEAAPCESVCPVNATVHDEQGLNVMAYNRCVGTRYCSNNCPYKVRRFNYLDYNKRSLKELRGPYWNGLNDFSLGYPTATLHSTGGEWDLARWWKDQNAGMRQEDEWDLIRMLKNPDVTVRMRGVMEKCTFCIQRIEGAKIAQKVKNSTTGDVEVPDGTFTTACSQACPAGAIVFGNIADPKSKVSQWKAQERNYSVLDFLKTKPRTTYLARVRNPNPEMPDYAKPLTVQEFNEKNNGHPESEAHEGAAHEHAAEKGAH